MIKLKTLTAALLMMLSFSSFSNTPTWEKDGFVFTYGKDHFITASVTFSRDGKKTFFFSLFKSDGSDLCGLENVEKGLMKVNGTNIKSLSFCRKDKNGVEYKQIVPVTLKGVLYVKNEFSKRTKPVSVVIGNETFYLSPIGFNKAVAALGNNPI
ncbi:TPA: hypothetical protein ACX6SJ_003766 [Photobacterium damselae]